MAAARVISGGASVTMSLTSTGIPQQRLQDGPRPLQIGSPFRGVGRLWKIEVVLRQRNHEFGVILNPGLLHSAASAEQPRRIVAQGLR